MVDKVTRTEEVVPPEALVVVGDAPTIEQILGMKAKMSADALAAATPPETPDPPATRQVPPPPPPPLDTKTHRSEK